MTYINLVDSLIKDRGVLKTPAIIKAFHKVDRADFVSEDQKVSAYEDVPLPIGYGQTISQPYTVAFMIELLEPQKGQKILDVGAGSGWVSALLAEIAGSDGTIFAVEKIPELLKWGKENVLRLGYRNVKFFQAGDEIGLKKYAPYDRIISGAAAESEPKELLDQLKIGGIAVLPILDSIVRYVRKSLEKFDRKEFYGFSFVPLVK